MNGLQEKIFDHLTWPNASAERRLALKDFIDRGFFSAITESSTKRYVEGYLEKNEHNFCKEGLDRFRKAIEPETHLAVLTVVVETTEHQSEGHHKAINETIISALIEREDVIGIRSFSSRTVTPTARRTTCTPSPISPRPSPDTA